MPEKQVGLIALTEQEVINLYGYLENFEFNSELFRKISLSSL